MLAVMYVWRLAAFPGAVGADSRDPRRAFGFFTLAAAADVLAARLAGDGNDTATAALLVIGGLSWILLS